MYYDLRYAGGGGCMHSHFLNVAPQWQLRHCWHVTKLTSPCRFPNGTSDFPKPVVLGASSLRTALLVLLHDFV